MTVEEVKALTSRDELHYRDCVCYRGPRGGTKITSQVWRVNGAVKTWKTIPDRVEVPIKHGLRSFGYITSDNCHLFHLASECDVTNTCH